MALCFMFGKYSAQAIKEISAERTAKASELVKKYGGEVKAIYALLGEKDLVIIIDVPGVAEAMKISVAMIKVPLTIPTSVALLPKQ